MDAFEMQNPIYTITSEQLEIFQLSVPKSVLSKPFYSCVGLMNRALKVSGSNLSGCLLFFR